MPRASALGTIHELWTNTPLFTLIGLGYWYRVYPSKSRQNCRVTQARALLAPDKRLHNKVRTLRPGLPQTGD
ncbi:MAG: hypothetical protein HW384_704 [Dehalococcoidia bacterium]|nr:hypothetical protein [Dehalococcoidia bacterium]